MADVSASPQGQLVLSQPVVRAITCTLSGTLYSLGNLEINAVTIAPLPINSGTVYLVAPGAANVGEFGAFWTTGSYGFPITPGATPITFPSDNLSSWYVFSPVAGNGIGLVAFAALGLFSPKQDVL